MGFYDYEKEHLRKVAAAQDEDNPSGGEKKEDAAKQDNEVIGKEPDDRKILDVEELQEHRKHCEAKPGNCPFEKVYNNIDDLSAPEPKISKEKGYDRLAMAMTQLYALAADMAKNAMSSDSEDAKDIVEIIEAGLDKIKEGCQEKHCSVKMDEAKTKYIISPPKRD